MECHVQGNFCIGQCGVVSGTWKGLVSRATGRAFDLGVSMICKPSHSNAPPGAAEIFS